MSVFRNIIFSAGGAPSIPHSGISFDGLLGSDGVTQTVVDNSNNIYVVGLVKESSYNSGFVAKLNSSGALLWQRIISIGSNISAETIALDPTQQYLYVSCYGLLKYDINGNLQWKKSIDGYNGRFVAVDSVGNVYLTTSSNWEGYIFKFNSSGTLLWQTNYTGMGYAQQIIVDNSDNLIVVGYLYWTGFIIKINSSGTLLWQRRTTGPGNLSMVHSAGVDINNNIYVTVRGGYTDPDRLSAVTTKLNSSGTVVWQRTAGISGIGTAMIQTLITDDNGNSYVFGFFLLTSTGIRQSYILKYNSSGVLQFEKSVTYPGSDCTLWNFAFLGSDKLYFCGSANGNGVLATSLLNGNDWNATTYVTDVEGGATYDDPGYSYQTSSLTIITGTQTDSAGSLVIGDAGLT